MVSISRTLKKSTFLVWQLILGSVYRALGGPFCVFYMDDLSIVAWKISKNGGNMKIFLESCKERSKLSVDGFGGRGDHLVAQKSNFKIFFFENDVIRRTPPAYLPAWYTVRVAKRHENPKFFNKCKVWVLSFPKTSLECFCDVWFDFYDSLNSPLKRKKSHFCAIFDDFGPWRARHLVS